MERLKHILLTTANPLLHGLTTEFRPLIWTEDIKVVNNVSEKLVSKALAEHKTAFQLIFGSVCYFLRIETFGSEVYALPLKNKEAGKLGVSTR